MSGREILDFAYANRLFPSRLHGATQWKTIQARLSEDILRSGDNSPFVRTEPGRFYLRELLPDGAERKIFRARPRYLDLNIGRMLTVNASVVDRWPAGLVPVSELVEALKRHGKFLTQAEIDKRPGTLKINTFVIVRRGASILSYRRGRYRSHKDEMLLERSIGFGAPVRERDYDLLDTESMGVVNSALRELSALLGMSAYVVRLTVANGLLTPKYVLRDQAETELQSLHAVLVFNCPPSFEPTKRRLAINDLRWTHLLELPNDISDIEPISRVVLHSSELRVLLAEA